MCGAPGSWRDFSTRLTQFLPLAGVVNLPLIFDHEIESLYLLHVKEYVFFGYYSHDKLQVHVPNCHFHIPVSELEQWLFVILGLYEYPVQAGIIAIVVCHFQLCRLHSLYM